MPQRNSVLRPLANQGGFSLVQVLVMLGIMGIVAAGMTKLQMQQYKTQNEIAFKANVIAIRQSLISALASDSAWQMTRTRNPSLQCSSPGQAYCGSGSISRTDVDLYDAAGNIILRSSSPTAGFRHDGTPCDAYSASGNANCPLKVSAKWRGVCQSAPCSDIQDFISVTFEYTSAGGNNYAFNPANYNIVELNRIKFSSQESPLMTCARAGKIFVGEGKTLNTYSADPQGCLEYSAFVGPQGEPGSPGAQGAPGSCVTLPSVPVANTGGGGGGSYDPGYYDDGGSYEAASSSGSGQMYQTYYWDTALDAYQKGPMTSDPGVQVEGSGLNHGPNGTYVDTRNIMDWR